MTSHYIYAFLISLAVMTVLDGLWLGLVAPAFYRKHIGYIMSKKPNWGAAALFYLIFVFGVTVFVVYPGWHHDYSLLLNTLRGALFGFVTYSTYDLTNQATLKKWPAILSAVDIAWGTVLSGAIAIIAVPLLKAIIK